jgi:iron(III) transport system substrate-binding protein
MNRFAGTIGVVGIAVAATFASQAALAQFRGYSQAEWAKITAEARKEGRVGLYSAAVPPVLNRLKADFEKLNPGITVEITRIVGTQLVSKMDQERETGADGADVAITPETTWVTDRIKQNQLKAPAGPASAAWPARYVVGGGAPLLAIEPMVIAYNTNLVKTPVNSYEDLLRPEFKGKLATPDLIATIFMAWYDWLEQTRGPKFLPALAAQSPKFYPSAVQSTQLLVAGELLGSTLTVPTIVTPLIAQGAPIKMVVPSSGVIGTPYYGVVAGWSKRPNAAQVFMDYVMSPAGQTTWAVNGEIASPLPNIANSLPIATTAPADPSKFTPEVAKEYKAKWDKIFK